MTNFFDRIMKVADSKGYKNPNDFAKNGLNWASSEKINRLKSGDKMPSIELLLEISNKFDDVNPGWLLTGRGDMLKSDIETEPKVISTNQEDYEKARMSGMFLIPEYSITFHAGMGVVSDPEYLVAHWSIPQAPRDSYIISMVGNSMSPLLMSGSKLLVRPFCFSCATDIPFGNIFAIAVADEWGTISTHIKILRRHPSKCDTHWIARSVNFEEYDDFDIAIENVKSLAMVVMHIDQHAIL